MAVVTTRQLLESGVHFGHQTRRWNPKMKRFIFGERNGIYIIDLQQSLTYIDKAYAFVRETVARGGQILFVGTKKQAQEAIAEQATRVGMPYVNQRWLGGMLTNFETISKRVAKMKEYQRMRDSGEFDAMPKKEALLMTRELEKLERNLNGIRDLERLPDAVFILDTKKEDIAVTEANKLAGMRFEQIASGEFKTDGDPDVAVTAAELARIKERVMFHAGLFFDAGSRATGLSVDEIRGQKAALYLGENAVRARLADGVSTLAECVARLEAETQVQGRTMVVVPSGPRGQQQTAGNKHMEMGMLALALGLAADAKDQDVTARASALVGVDTKLRELTGKGDPAAALAVIDGWRESAAKLGEANKELAKIRDREESSAHAALVSQGEASAQIVPGNREKVLRNYPTAAQLAAYLETAPAALPSAGKGDTAAHAGGTAGQGDTGAQGGKDGDPKALTYKGKTWDKLTPSEQASLYQADQGLYDTMRGAAMAQKDGAR